MNLSDIIQGATSVAAGKIADNRGCTPEKLERWAKELGEKLSGKVFCPVCTLLEQEMFTYGDEEDVLFCPHCELELHFEFFNPWAKN